MSTVKKLDHALDILRERGCEIGQGSHRETDGRMLIQVDGRPADVRRSLRISRAPIGDKSIQVAGRKSYRTQSTATETFRAIDEMSVAGSVTVDTSRTGVTPSLSKKGLIWDH